MTIQQNYPAIKSSLNLDFANTKQLDPRITYSRASTGTYYDGKTVAKAEENLFVQSQFVTGWGSSNVSQTANATTAPDGTTTALSIIVNTTAAVSHSVVQTTGATAGNTYTYSVYAKANGYTNVQLFGDSSGNFTATFDLVAATAAYVGSATAATIVAVGNGWYRCSTTFVMSGPSRLNIQGFPAGATASNYGNTFTGDGTSGIFVWGAQLEQRSFATAYTPTTTAPITNYIPVLQTASAGTPRFDHNPITGESLGLLIEEQRTNLLTYSSDFDNPVWLKTELSTNANATTAPNGLGTAHKFIPSANASAHWIQNSITATTAQFTGSVYVKLDGSAVNKVTLYPGSSATFTHFDLSNLTTNVEANVASTSITPVGNGWYRLTATWLASVTVDRFRIYASSGTTGAASTAGNGFSGIYIWGAQLEAGAFATSYIPTVASQVTRAADSASMTGTNFSSWYNQSQGTVYVEANSNRPLGNFLSLVDIGVSSSTTNRNTLSINNNFISAASITNGVAGLVAETVNMRTAGVAFKGAYSAKENSILSCLNGGVVATDISGSFLKTVDNMKLGVRNDFGVPLNGWISKVSYYPIAVTSTQIQALTS